MWRPQNFWETEEGVSLFYFLQHCGVIFWGAFITGGPPLYRGGSISLSRGAPFFVGGADYIGGTHKVFRPGGEKTPGGGKKTIIFSSGTHKGLRVLKLYRGGHSLVYMVKQQ